MNIPDNWTRIMPGIVAEPDGTLHVSVPDLLNRFGWPDDAEHRAECQRIVREVIAQHFAGVSITEID